MDYRDNPQHRGLLHGRWCIFTPALTPKARCAKVDTEAEQSIAAQFDIRSIPTLIVFKGGKEIARQAGAMQAEQLKAWVRQYV